MKITVPLGTKLTIGSGTKNFVPDYFSPLQLPGLLGWYDASDETTLTDVSGRYSDWVDKSGNGNDLGQITNAYRPYSGRSIGGLNAVEYRQSESLYRTDSFGLTGNPALTIFMLAQPDTTDGGSSRYFHMNDDSDPELIAIGTDNSWRHDDGNRDFTPTATSGVATLITGRRNLGDDYDNAELRYKRENLAQVSSDNPTSTPNILDTYFSIGGKTTTGLAAADGLIAEFIIYDSYLNDAQVSIVESYLWQKYLASLYPGLTDGAYYDAVNKTSPIRYYRMGYDDTMGATEPDLAIGSNDATHDIDSSLSIIGPQKDITKFSREFDGVEPTIAPTISGIDGKTAASFSLWFFNNDISSDQWIFSTKDSAANERFNAWFDSDNSVGPEVNTFSFQMGNGVVAERLSAPSNLGLQSVWQHLVFVVNGTEKKTYIDGILVASKDTGTINPIATQTANLKIGEYNGLGCNGNIADFVVWDRELSETEASNLFASATVPSVITDPFGFSEWSALPTNVNYGIAPDGTMTSSRTENTSGSDFESNSFYLPDEAEGLNKVYTHSIYVKEILLNLRQLSFLCYDSAAATSKGRGGISFNFSTETGAPIYGANTLDSGVDIVGNGWYRIWFSCVPSYAHASGELPRLLYYDGIAGNQTLGDSYEIWNPQMTRGHGPPPPVLDPRYFPRN